MAVTEPTIPGIIAAMPAKDSAFFQALGSRIAQARKERGITQQALAEALGIAQQTLGHYEVARARIAADLKYLFKVIPFFFTNLGRTIQSICSRWTCPIVE